MMRSVLVVLAAAMVLTLLMRVRRRRHMRRYHTEGMETYAGQVTRAPHVYRQLPVDRTYKHGGVVPRPPIQNGPLAPYLAAAVDSALPTVAPGESMMYSKEEVKGVLQRVVDRINSLNPGLHLVIVYFDNVQKTVDAYKTTRYEADVQVHSVAKAFSSRVTVKAEIAASGKLFVRALGLHNAQPDASTIAAAADFGEQYAEFVPALSIPVVMK